jgi:hypothetical protein
MVLDKKNNAVDIIVSTIKNKRRKVEKFLVSHGKAVRRTDTDVSVGKKFSELLREKPREVKAFLESESNFLGLAIGSLTDIIGSGKDAKISEQQGQDAITLALINAGISKSKPDNTTTYVAFGLLGLILIIIGILLYLKYKK